jgi:predicted lysophospholipase L1 biosynthesis ABC-type transport system permease subunit
MDVEEIVSFIDEFELEVEAAGFYFSRVSNGSTGWDFVVADFSGPRRFVAESLLAAITARSNELLDGSDSRIHDAADRQRVAEALASDSWPGFSHLIATMNHRAALALADAETGERLVAVKAIIEDYPLASWSKLPSY